MQYSSSILVIEYCNVYVLSIPMNHIIKSAPITARIQLRREACTPTTAVIGKFPPDRGARQESMFVSGMIQVSVTPANRM
jgi:hypothetical protein